MTAIQRARGSRRGMALLEMVALLGVLAVVAMLTTQIIVMMMRATKEANARDTMIHRVDTALEALRRDVWSASAIHVSGGGGAAADRVELEVQDGAVVWEMGADGALTRRGGAGGGAGGGGAALLPRVWIQMPKFSFTGGAGGGARLIVGVESGPPGAATHETVTLVSQRILAGGGT